ncbi:aerotolerance protein [Pontibacter ruber]|uniref:Aerotolerance protein n=1 Tax=Pontibacter ruber TaxID=1343895 RepID=A0ABW5CXY1_9BACT|nr:aerotolerance protein [Pontibacter ruber]
MKPLFFVIFLISLVTGGLQTITKINEYAKEAAQAYGQEDYTTAMHAYEYLLNDLDVEDDQLRLNLAHTYFRAGLLQKAQQQYAALTDHPSSRMRAMALLQMGNIAAEGKKYKQALALFRNALVAEPGNETARYNYELLKKYLDQHPELDKEPEDEQAMDEMGQQEENNDQPPPAEEDLEPQPKKKPDNNGDREEEIEKPEQADSGELENKGGDNKDGSTPGKQNKEGQKDQEQQSGKEQGDQEGLNTNNNFDPGQQQRTGSAEEAGDQDKRAQTRGSRLKEVKISQEKANMLLDAMRNAELQYIQQLPKKAKYKPDPSKPDW